MRTKECEICTLGTLQGSVFQSGEVLVVRLDRYYSVSCLSLSRGLFRYLIVLLNNLICILIIHFTCHGSLGEVTNCLQAHRLQVVKVGSSLGGLTPRSVLPHKAMLCRADWAILVVGPDCLLLCREFSLQTQRKEWKGSVFYPS